MYLPIDVFIPSPSQHSQEVGKLSGQLKTAEKEKKAIQEKVGFVFFDVVVVHYK